MQVQNFEIGPLNFFEAENQNSVSNKIFLFLGSNYSQGFVKIALKL